MRKIINIAVCFIIAFVLGICISGCQEKTDNSQGDLSEKTKTYSLEGGPSNAVVYAENEEIKYVNISFEVTSSNVGIVRESENTAQLVELIPSDIAFEQCDKGAASNYSESSSRIYLIFNFKDSFILKYTFTGDGVIFMEYDGNYFISVGVVLTPEEYSELRSSCINACSWN